MLTSTSIGAAFEHKVEAELRRLGFETWADCYAPTEQGYTQIDIIAMRPGQLWVVECKNWGGVVDTIEWKRYYNGKVYNMTDFTKQNSWHGIVVHEHVHIPALSVVVVNDSMKFKDNLFPSCVVHLSQLGRMAGSTTACIEQPLRTIMDARSTFLQWTAVDDAVKKQHRVRLQDKYHPPETLPLP